VATDNNYGWWQRGNKGTDYNDSKTTINKVQRQRRRTKMAGERPGTVVEVEE
jgi:hypothetical protein